MTTDEEESIESIASKLESIAESLRQGCVTPNTMQIITSLTSSLQDPQIAAAPSPDGSSEEDIEGHHPEIMQYLFRGWFLTMMMNELNGEDEEDESEGECEDESEGEREEESEEDCDTIELSNPGFTSYFSSAL